MWLDDEVVVGKNLLDNRRFLEKMLDRADITLTPGRTIYDCFFVVVEEGRTADRIVEFWITDDSAMRRAVSLVLLQTIQLSLARAQATYIPAEIPSVREGLV